MQSALMVSQIVLSILLSLSILLQSRGGGLGSSFGSSEGFYVSKRGAEKVLFNAALVLMVLFIVNSIALLFV